MAESGISMRYHVLLIIFFSYIYDAIRRGFIETRKERLKNFDEHIRKATVGVSQGYKEHLRCFGSLLGRQQRRLQHRQVLQTEHGKQKDSEAGNRLKQHGNSEDLDCPLSEMPKFMRAYQRASFVYIVYSFVRYTIVSMLQYNFIDVDPIYACYLPGRLSFLFDLAYELPAISLVIICYHLIYRCNWFFFMNRLNLDCFVFAVCSRECVREKEFRVLELKADSFKSRRTYIKELMFYQCMVVGNCKLAYSVRSHRTLAHWRKLEKFIRFMSIFCIANLTVLGLPIALVILQNILSNEYFDHNYRHCRSFAHRPVGSEGAFEWSFDDPFRFRVFFFDFIDNLVLLVDTASAMAWPFTASIVCTHDLTLKMEEICRRLELLRCRMVYVDLQEGRAKTRRPTRLAKSIEFEIRVVQHDILDAFEKICEVDSYINFFSTFCIFCWFVINLGYQIVSILRQRLLVPNLVVHFLQILGLLLLGFTFSNLGRPYTAAVRMYKQLCSVMALDPNVETTKPNWTGIIEYYCGDRSRYTLHLGSAALSMSNYLKSITWFISCAIILINLLWAKHENKSLADASK